MRIIVSAIARAFHAATSPALLTLSLVGLFALTVLTGCAEKKVEPDPFFERWRDLAERARGASPTRPPTKVDLPAQTRKELRQDEQKPVEKSLPKTRVTMRLNNADINVILQALARAAEQNILVNSDIKGMMNLNITNQPWDEVFKGVLHTNGLRYAWEGNILRVVTLQDLERDRSFEEKSKTQNQEIKRVEPLLTKVLKVSYADAKAIQANFTTLLTTDKEGKPLGSIQVDPHANALVVKAIREDILKMADLLNELDQPRAQIRLEAKIVEATKDVARDLGIQWGGQFFTSRIGSEEVQGFTIPGGSFNRAANAIDSPFSQIGTQGVGHAVNFPARFPDGEGFKLGLGIIDKNRNVLEVQLSALERDNKINILSTPSLTTMDNQEALTENGERVPFVATTPEGKLEVKFEDAVLALRLTPNVIDENNLKLNIEIKKDEVDNTRNVQGNPFIIKKKTKTSLICRNGETVVISGLSRQRKEGSDNGVPGLKDVPGLGYAFKRDQKRNFMDEVLIFITPQILEKDAPAVKAGLDFVPDME